MTEITRQYAGGVTQTTKVYENVKMAIGRQYDSGVIIESADWSKTESELHPPITPLVFTQGLTAPLTYAGPAPVVNWDGGVGPFNVKVAVGAAEVDNVTGTAKTYTLAGYADWNPGQLTLKVIDKGDGDKEITTGPITHGGKPVFTKQPTNKTIAPGAAGFLDGKAAGGAAMTYQWKKDGANLSNNPMFTGTTTLKLNITGATLADTAGKYKLVATNSAGFTESTEVTLTVA